MKQLNWYQIFGNTHKIPDGSTVTPTDDVQILLNCANIWDKAYTTISELLADTTSLGAVIIDNNAVNYLVRSTTWASSVTADATAMTYIGQNNYCANTLLADATWLEAICNSEYFESVLNVKVPKMTSNTTPSGVCSTYGGGLSAYPAWMAFDRTTGNHGYVANAVGNGLGYKFTEDVSVKMMFLQPYWNNDTYKLQVSSDNSTWVDVATTSGNSSNGTYCCGVNLNSCQYTRVIQTTKIATGTTWHEYKIIQFYGRKDV